MSTSKSHMPPPRDPQTGATQPPRDQPGYYPGFSTLAQREYWDDATRAKIEARLKPRSALAFFTVAEAQTLQAILDCVLPQSDRLPEWQVPILFMIDERLSAKRFDGFVYEGCPDADTAHRLGIRAIDAIAAQLHHTRFADLNVTQRETILMSLREGKPPGEQALWEELPPKYYWSLLVQDAVSAYYAHPFVWDEIGFGGPAYPRGYMRTTEGKPEPWEKDETRYEWLAPEESQSDRKPDKEELFPGHLGRRTEGK